MDLAGVAALLGREEDVVVVVEGLFVAGTAVSGFGASEMLGSSEEEAAMGFVSEVHIVLAKTGASSRMGALPLPLVMGPLGVGCVLLRSAGSTRSSVEPEVHWLFRRSRSAMAMLPRGRPPAVGMRPGFSALRGALRDLSAAGLATE